MWSNVKIEDEHQYLGVSNENTIQQDFYGFVQ